MGDWQTVRRRQGRRWEVNSLAREVAAALLTRQKANQPWEQTGWWCGCGLHNWATRAHCRGCGRHWQEAPGQQPAKVPAPTARAPQLPAASAWADGPPLLQRPAAQAAVLDKAAAAARAAGAPAAALEGLARTAADARQRAEEAKPAEHRLATAERKLERAKAIQDKAADALSRAEAAAAQAKQDVLQAEKELACLRSAMAGAARAGAPTDSLALGTRKLLEALERVPLGAQAEMPSTAPVYAAMAELHSILGTEVLAAKEKAAMAPEGAGGEAGVEECASLARPEAVGKPEPAESELGSNVFSEDEVMEELEGVADDSEAELAAIARRLKRARRG